MSVKGTVVIDIVANKGQYDTAMTAVQQHLIDTRGLMESVASLATKALAGMGGAVAAAVKEFADADRQQALVEGALAANGEDVEKWTARLQTAAEEIQRTTKYSDDFAMSLYATALGMGVAAADTEALTRNAIALSASTGGLMSVQQAMRALINSHEAENDMLLKRFIPALRAAKTEAERYTAIHGAIANGTAMVTRETGSLGGQLGQVWNSITNVAEEAGRAMNTTLSDAVAWIKRTADGARAYIAANAEWITSITKTAAEYLILLAILPRVASAIGGVSTAVAGLVSATATMSRLTVAMNAAAVMGGVLNLVVAGLAITAAGAAFAVAKLEANLARLEALWKSVADARSEAESAAADRAATNDPELQAKALEREIAARTRLVAGELASQEDLQKKLEDAKNRASAYREHGTPEEQRQADGQLAAAEKNLEMSQKVVAQERRKLETLNAQRETLAKTAQQHAQDAEAEKRQNDAFDKRLKALQTEAALAGESEAAQERIKALAEGMSASQADALAKEAEIVAKRKEQAEATKAVADELSRIASETAAALGQSTAGSPLRQLAGKGASGYQLQFVAQALIGKATATAAQKQKELGEELRKQAMTEEEITAQKIAQYDAAQKLGLITSRQHGRLMEMLREEQAQKRLTGWGDSPLTMYDRMAKASLTASIPLNRDDRAIRAADATIELTKIQREASEAIKSINQTMLEVKRSLPVVGAFGR